MVSYSYRIIDGFELIRDGKALPFRGAKVRALIAWFCISGQTQIARSRIADLLWSGSSEEKARASLRNALYSLREAGAGTELLSTDHLTVRANFPAPRNEVAEAIAAWDAGDGRALAALSLSDAELRFAPDLFGLDPEFDEFLRNQRGRALAACFDALRNRLLAAGEVTEASRVLAEKLRELAPQDETATRHLMMLEIATGNSAAALGHYNRLWQVLDEEFDVEPSEATQLLAIQVKSQAVAADPAAPPPDRRDPEERITIFVRPVAAAGLPEETLMMIGGMQAEITAALLAIEEWVVIETDAHVDLPPRRGRYELKSAFSPGLGEVRLILTLKDLSTRQVIWTRPVAVNRSDWMKNSALAVQRLAAHLTGRLESHYITQIGTLPDDQLPDYDKLIRARWLMNDWRPESDRRAEELMRSVQAGGELGLRAKIGLAELLNSRGLVFPGLTDPRAGVPEALSLAESCVAEGFQRADVWLALAWAALQSGRNERAIEAAEAALLGSQSSPRRIASAAEIIALAGQVDRGVWLSGAVERMDSGLDRVTLGYRVSIALLAGDNEACMDLADRADGAIVLGHGYAAAAAVMTESGNRARDFWARFGEDLARRWQGPVPAEPLDWFLAATPLREGPVRDRIAAALQRLS